MALRRLSDFERRLKGDLSADLHRLRDVATPAPITLDDLPPALRERYVGKSGKWLVRAFSKDDLWNYAPLQNFVEQVRTVDPDATGKPFGTLEGLDAMKNDRYAGGVTIASPGAASTTSRASRAWKIPPFDDCHRHSPTA